MLIGCQGNSLAEDELDLDHMVQTDGVANSEHDLPPSML